MLVAQGIEAGGNAGWISTTVLVPQVVRAVRDGGGHYLLPFTGQSAQLVHDVLPAAELVARLVREAEDALGRAAACRRP